MINKFDAESMLSHTAYGIPPSGIRKFFDILTNMKDAVSLGVGEPDFVTPWHIRDAGIKSLENGATYYTSNWGLIELRNEISKYLKRRFNLNYDGDNEVLVTVGGSEAIDLAFRAFLNRGDEVLVPEPSFVCYKPCVELAGGVAVPVATYMENNFALTCENIEKHITPKTKMLVLPFPNNPTGAILTRDDLEKICEVVKKHNLIVLSDEIYAELTYGGHHVSIAELEGMKERTVLVSGFSKAFAMTGWRLGYVCAPAKVLKVMTKIHQYAIMCSPTTSQFAAIEALKHGDDDIEKMKAEYDARRRYMVAGFRKLGLDCFEPKGAFYMFPSIKGLGITSEEFCRRLLIEKKVAVIPGNAFGDSGEGYVRCSYAYSLQVIKKALKLIGEFLEENKDEFGR